ncbi:hypothetical protein GALL_95730 [mine drainage metagenome]|uniref:DoxX n=1 Tax=mine drainage metagenome TaxID=410659 RepID=A0A1J5SWK5_9ZZZZ
MFQQSITSSNLSSTDKSKYDELVFKIIWINRIALSICFLWFGFLKIIHLSPAEPLVISLYSVTIVRHIPLQVFIPVFGIFECMIGLFWLIPKFTYLAFTLFAMQMFTTFLPLIYLPQAAWQQNWVPTLTGQYIIKNIVFLASATTIIYITKKIETHKKVRI